MKIKDIFDYLDKRPAYTVDAERAVLPSTIRELSHLPSEGFVDLWLGLKFRGKTNEELFKDAIRQIQSAIGLSVIVLSTDMSTDAPVKSKAQIKIGRIIYGDQFDRESEIEPIEPPIQLIRVR